MIKRLLCFAFLPILILAGCGGGTKEKPEDMAQVAYQWEKARFDRDYDKQQPLVYEGTYDAYKGATPIDSGLAFEDIKYEVYFDKESKNYYVFTDFKNPNGENKVDDTLLLREKDGAWKIDTDGSRALNRENIKQEYELIGKVNQE